jgi:hypothetical protein
MDEVDTLSPHGARLIGGVRGRVLTLAAADVWACGHRGGARRIKEKQGDFIFNRPA